MFTVCFDVDGTLITLDNKPNYKMIYLFHALQALGCEMYIWSGGGLDYARQISDKLGLYAKIIEKGSMVPQLAIDDQDVQLGKANLCIPGIDI